jgi:hypothetical protein
MQTNSVENFLMLYGSLSGLLILLIVAMFAVSGRIFD